jgi:hypothetical protein
VKKYLIFISNWMKLISYVRITILNLIIFVTFTTFFCGSLSLESEGNLLEAIYNGGSGDLDLLVIFCN